MLAGSFVLFAALAPDALTNGDDAVYAQQIKSFELGERTTHLGYYLLGSPLALLAPDFSDYSLNAMSAFFGALTVAAVGLLTRALCGSSTGAIFSGLFLATNYLFVYNCVFAEIYISQTFFLVLAFGLLLYAQPVAGGLAFGLSTLISPSTLLAVPGLVVLRPRLRLLFKFAAAAALLLVLCLAWVLGDYLFGDRGLLGATSGGVDLKATVMKEGLEIVLGVFVWLPLLLLGILELATRAPFRRFGAVLLTVWVFIFVFGERFADVPAQLSTHALLGVAVGIGVERLNRWWRLSEAGGRRLSMALLVAVALVPVAAAALARPFSGTLQRLPGFLPPVIAGTLIVTALGAAWLPRRRSARLLFPLVLALISGAVTLTLIRQQSEETVAYRETVLRAGKVAESHHLVVGTWTRGILFNHYLYGQPYHESWLDVQRLEGSLGEADQAAARKRWRAALAAGYEIWFLGDHPEYLAEARRQNYHVEPFGRIFHVHRRQPR